MSASVPASRAACLHSIYDHIHTEVLPLETAQAGVAAADRDLQAAKRNLEVLETQLGESMLSCAKGGPVRARSGWSERGRLALAVLG